MDDTQRYTLDSRTGLPKISPALIKAYRRRPRQIETDFHTLKTTDPAIAVELMIRAELHSKDLAAKQAFTEGALFVYTLLLQGLQSQVVLSLLERSAASAGVVDVDQPPSA